MHIDDWKLLDDIREKVVGKVITDIYFCDGYIVVKVGNIKINFANEEIFIKEDEKEQT